MLFLIALLLMNLPVLSQQSYVLKIQPVDKSPGFLQNTFNPDTLFAGQTECQIYVSNFLASLQAKGYITASVDSMMYDSLSAKMVLFVGELYKWSSVNVDEPARQWLMKMNLAGNLFDNQRVDFEKVDILQQRILHFFENNGYPFAKIWLDSMNIDNNLVSGKLNIDPGPLYRIDSIQVTGNAKISSDYLQNFLDIKNNSVYNKEKLAGISGELKKLNYIEEEFPPQFKWRTSGGVVELFLKQKKSSQVNFLIGVLPNNDPLSNRKVLITGEGLLNLKNAFGAGETIGLVWQKLQAASQRLNIGYQQPYLFKTPFGIDFGFDMFKRDSSYLNFSLKLGAQFSINSRQQAQLFFQQFSTIVSNINTDLVLRTRKLPAEADVRVSNIGLEYHLNTTNYIFNPVRGAELSFITAAGNKIIKPNNQILELKDADDPTFDFKSLYDTIKAKSYQVRTLLTVAKYFPIGNKRRSAIKAVINGGYLMSSNIFRNELFQIGGYRLLRGFDEASQFLSQYAIGTAEYRYLIGENSYFNVFSDGGWGKDAGTGVNRSFAYLSAGLGLAFETKVGLFNLAWAVGSRNDIPFNLRQSKIHFGFISYF
ncbi:MAG: hypothetical protein IPH58_02860 [Sphingobacteriales bacterium]|nr:hypothetical protein [Sphingobacteriales bacterium]